MCHVSCVMCHVSHVMCQMSHFFFSDKVVKLSGGGSVINGAYPSSFEVMEHEWVQLNFGHKKGKKMLFPITPKGTPHFIHCLFKVLSLATLNKQMLSSLATYNALSLVNHKD